MSTPESTDTSSSDPDEIEADIARHRAELARTVDELSDRLDVKKQAKHQVDQARSAVDEAKAVAVDRAKEFQARAQRASPGELASMLGPAAGAVAGVVLAGILIGRRRR